jgi:fatty acid desaturase
MQESWSMSAAPSSESVASSQASAVQAGADPGAVAGACGGASGGASGGARIKWYRCHVDKELMSQLKQRSDLRGLFCQALPHLGLIVASGALSLYAFHQRHWPLLAVGLMLHGTFYGFWGLGGAGHELCHKTVFRSQWLNAFFLRFSAFIGYFNYPLFIASHVKHHQYTLHMPDDLEVVLPQTMTWKTWLYATANPAGVWQTFKRMLRLARGRFEGEWENKLVSSDKSGQLGREIMRCARFQLAGHLLLAAAFIASGQWFLVVLVTLAPFYAQWLNALMGFPQHAGLVSGVPDFRLSCRTFVANPFFNFLYWQMNYHIEHHMFPGVPCHQLKRLRAAVEHDMPPAHRSLWATWREIADILRRQKQDPGYAYRQPLPQTGEQPLDTAGDAELLAEAQARA